MEEGASPSVAVVRRVHRSLDVTAPHGGFTWFNCPSAHRGKNRINTSSLPSVTYTCPLGPPRGARRSAAVSVVPVVSVSCRLILAIISRKLAARWASSSAASLGVVLRRRSLDDLDVVEGLDVDVDVAAGLGLRDARRRMSGWML